MCAEGSRQLPVTEEQINRYKRMTKDELDKLQGMEREQARYYSNHTFSRKFTLKPRDACSENNPSNNGNSDWPT